MDDETARKAERVKQLLAGYYGANEVPGGAGGHAGAGGDAAGGNKGRRGHAGAPVPAMATLDSPAFDANQHLVQMLKTSSLERLMVEHRNTAKEIKNLDTDMQQLVTENYNKFISATDTIRVMHKEIEKAIPDVTKLTGIMNNVSERSTTISTKLQARQDKMEELYRVQSLLKKLQAVFDLPKRMRAALEEDVLDTAVSFYAEAQPLLRKYGNKGTFRHIAADSDLVAKEISQVLKRRLAERKDDTEQCVLLLRKLGEPDDTLQDRYLAGRSQRLRRILKDAHSVLEAMVAAAAAVRAQPGTPARTAAHQAAAAARSQLEAAGTWGFAEDGSAPGLKAFVKALDEKLINAMQETVMNVMRFFMSKDLSAEEAADKRKPLVALAREVFTEYFNIVRRALADSISASVIEAACLRQVAELSKDSTDALSSPDLVIDDKWGADTLAQALITISADLSMVSGGLPELGLRERAASLVSGALQHHIDMCFAGLRSRVQSGIDHISARLSATQHGQAGGEAASAGQLKKAYAGMMDLVGRGLEALMQGLKMYEQQPRLLASCYSDFMQGLQASLQRWFLQLVSSFLAVSGVRHYGDAVLQADSPLNTSSSLPQDGSRSDTFPVTSQLLTLLPQPSAGSSKPGGGADANKAGLVLLLAKLCIYLEQSTVPWVMGTLANLFAGRSMPVQSSAAADMPPAFIPGEVGRRLATTSSTLLSAYVELHGRQLSLMVRRSVAATSWLHHKEPRGPRPVCDLLAERLGKADAEVVQLVEETGRRTDISTVVPTTAARNERGFGASLLLETGNVERNLAKIFREKVKVFGAPVQLSQAAILGAIAGVGLKSLVECIRLQTLGRAGLQQLQLDCHYLRPLIRRYTGGQTQQVVDSLLDEVVSAGVERSLDPTLLEPSVLERILASLEPA